MSAPVLPHHEFEATLLRKLATSQRFRAYQEAFRTATGLPLRMLPADPEGWSAEERQLCRHPFCPALAPCPTSCETSQATWKRLEAESEVPGAHDCPCFRGLSVTAVPVKLGASVIGYLRTGDTFFRTPDEPAFDHLLVSMGRKLLDKKAEGSLKSAYLGSRLPDPQRYEAMAHLLGNLAEHLAGLVSALANDADGDGPEAFAKARKFIHEFLDQPLSLGQIARHAGLSESHFCRLFKDSAGLTLTDYVNRCRVDWAKRELLRPESRVSEIAFHVGYQSLSQFNRSFVRIVGASPTAYRRERIEGYAS